MSESTPATTDAATATNPTTTNPTTADAATATDMPEGTKTYVLHCHCGENKVELADITPITAVTSCNCSICAERGLLIVFVPKEKFGAAAQSGSLGTYQWNKRVLDWRFCKSCGSTVFATGPGPVWGINVSFPLPLDGSVPRLSSGFGFGFGSLGIEMYWD